MVFGKRKRKKHALTPIRPKKKAPLINLPVEDDDPAQVNQQEVPPHIVNEGVQTGDIKNNHQDILNEENNILFPNFKKDNQAERIAIANVYQFILGAPSMEEWDGPNGTIRRICNMFGWGSVSNKNRKIRKVFLECEESLNKGIQFNANKTKELRTGRPPVIQRGSIEEGIIADWMEADMGARMTTKMVNEHRKSEGLELVSINVILRHMKKMAPKVTPIKKKSQGNNDNFEWVNARYCQCLQFLIRLKIISKQDLIDNIWYTLPIPQYFQEENLPPLNINQIVWFDETHIEQSGISSCHISKKQVRFPRDENGKYDPNGSYGKERTETSFKYSKQAKFCLGVASIKKSSYSLSEGVRCKSISYTNKKIIAEKDWIKKIKDEIHRVRSLKKQAKNSPWLKNERLNDDRIWEGDDILFLKNVGKSKKAKLVELGIVTVGDLKNTKKKD